MIIDFVGQLVVQIYNNNNNIVNDFLVISRIYQLVNDDLTDIQGTTYP
jgi:hypothetical protein